MTAKITHQNSQYYTAKLTGLKHHGEAMRMRTDRTDRETERPLRRKTKLQDGPLQTRDQ